MGSRDALNLDLALKVEQLQIRLDGQIVVGRPGITHELKSIGHKEQKRCANTTSLLSLLLSGFSVCSEDAILRRWWLQSVKPDAAVEQLRCFGGSSCQR